MSNFQILARMAVLLVEAALIVGAGYGLIMLLWAVFGG